MGVNCVVVVREVWDTRDLIDAPLEGGAIKAGLDTRFEPEDLNALETALRLKDEHGGTVTAVTVGEARSVDVLRECLYRGVDEVRRIEGNPLELDAHAYAAKVAGAVGELGGADLILVGTTVVDGVNSLVGPHLASILDVDTVSWVDAIDEIGDGKAVAKRAIELGYEYVEVPLPAVLSIGVALLEDDPRAPRSAKAMLKLKMKKVPIETLSPVGGAAATRVAGYEEVPQRVIESKEVDPEDESALQSMLDELLKGES
jgi:electron transfer flavoprotein beta subunit